MDENSIGWDVEDGDIVWGTDQDDSGAVSWNMQTRWREGTDQSVHIDSEDRTDFRHCTKCGRRIDSHAEICPHCGVRVAQAPQTREERSRLSYWAGVFVGFIALIFLSGIPILGPILAGLVAGVIAGGGAARGASAGFTTGALGFFILAMILMIGGSFIGISSDTLIGAFAPLLGAFSALLLMVVGLFYGILCLIGGAIGGVLRG